MIFKLKTLIDITETGARRGDDPRKQQQQQNFFTTLQTISLRANPTVTESPKSELILIKNLNFGSTYSGKHRVWSWSFSFEQSDSHNIEFLLNDFDFVPIINNLDETIKLNDSAFITSNEKSRNIIFEIS